MTEDMADPGPRRKGYASLTHSGPVGHRAAMSDRQPPSSLAVAADRTEVCPSPSTLTIIRER